MTREEALIQLRIGPGINEDVSEEYNEAVNMAIKALESQPTEDEKVIRISKGTLKARTGRYVIYDVEWLKTHFNTTEAKIYGQPQSEKRTEERTETHACDCISREALDNTISDLTYWHFENGRLIPGGGGIETETVYKVDDVWRLTHILPSVTPQPKEEPQQKTGHWIEHDGALGIPHIECSKCGCWFLKRDLPHNSYCPNCGSRNHWEWELKIQEVKE